MAAARPIAAMDSLGPGSQKRLWERRSGSCSRMDLIWAGPATTVVRVGEERGSKRSQVAWMRDLPLRVRSSRNLGCPSRERGQRRVPAPPAGITT